MKNGEIENHDEYLETMKSIKQIWKSKTLDEQFEMLSEQQETCGDGWALTFLKFMEPKYHAWQRKVEVLWVEMGRSIVEEGN